MQLDPVRNFAKAQVSTGYDAVATSIVLVSGAGARLPIPATDGAFNLVWWNDTDFKDPADDPNREIVRCTARTTDTLTVTRAQEGTTATVKNLAGKTYRMVLPMTRKTIDDISVSIGSVNSANFTYGETIAVNNAVYVRASDGRALRTNASFNDERIHSFVGFAKEAGVLNDVRRIQTAGVVTGFSGLVIGADYFLSNTAGAISTIAGILRRRIGTAISATELMIQFVTPTTRVAPLTISDFVQNSNDATRSTTSETFVRLKQMRINEGISACRIAYVLQTSTGGFTVFSRLQRDSSVLAEHQTSGGQVFTHDLFNLAAGETLQIWARGLSVSIFPSVFNMRLTYSRIINITQIEENVLATPLITTTDMGPFSVTNQDP